MKITQQSDKESLLFKGKRFFVENGVLDLNSQLIYDISEIENLDTLKNLESLVLSGNKISEIDGLEPLTN